MSTIQQRRDIERRICERVIADLLAAGFRFTVDGGGDEPDVADSTDTAAMMAVLMDVDDAHLMVLDGTTRKQRGWVLFVFGNDGWDVINDYSTNLSQWMEPIEEYTSTLADECSAESGAVAMVPLTAPEMKAIAQLVMNDTGTITEDVATSILEKIRGAVTQ